MLTKFLALTLRGTSIGAKFLLLIALSKILSIYDLGVISLIITSVTFIIFILGFDFYNYSHREIIENQVHTHTHLVNQFWFHFICYIIFFPLIFLIFLNDIIPFEYILPFYILLILEHLSQEIFRFLNLFNKPHLANITLFFRTAFWIVLLFGVEYLWFNNEITIDKILIYWIFGSAISILFTIFYFTFITRVNPSDISFFKLDKLWIKKGLSISLPFFIGTIAYKIIEYSDRYMIDWFLNKEQVGIYSFFTNYANIVNVIVNTITITLIVPNLLRVINSKDKDNISKETLNFFKEIIITTILVSVLIAVLIFPTLEWLDKPEFNSEIVVYFIVLIGNIFLNISLYYHFILYAYKKDKLILKPTLIAAFTNILLNLIFLPIFGLKAVALSTLFSFALILYFKRKYWLNFKSSIN